MGLPMAMTPPLSDHFNGKRFFYPGGPAERGLGDLLRWKLTSRPAHWPRRLEMAPGTLPPPPRGHGVVATWIGHSTFLLQTPQGNFLTDPVFSERIGPGGWAGPRRVIAPGLPWSALPRIDAVLLSHDHYDHCDLPTLRRLAEKGAPPVVAPLGHAKLLAAGGRQAPVAELDWWQTHELAGGATVTLVPSLHWCRRWPCDTNRRLWGGFILRAGGRQVYFLGDSGYDEVLFAEIAAALGAVPTWRSFGSGRTSRAGS